jgi:hypothetical protein
MDVPKLVLNAGALSPIGHIGHPFAELVLAVSDYEMIAMRRTTLIRRRRLAIARRRRDRWLGWLAYRDLTKARHGNLSLSGS